MKVISYGETYDVEVFRTTYQSNDSLAIILRDAHTGEPFATLTVNLPDGAFGDKHYAFVDTNNCPWAEEFIKENELGEPTGLLGHSGYCEYPLYEFYIDKIEEL